MSVATSPSGLVSAGLPKDLIESKFDELAKRILDELKQATQRADFFQAIDQILSEPAGGMRRHDLQAHRKLMLQKRRATAAAASHDEQTHKKIEKVTTVTSTSNLNTEALQRQYDSLAERQRQQQEQLDSHQQILFDSQYRSLPSEITQAVAGHEQRRAQHRAAAAAPLQKSSSQTTSPVKNGLKSPSQDAMKLKRDSANDQQSSPIVKQKLTISSPGKTKGGVVSSASSSSINNSASRQRSAIPQSTILSGIAGAAYPLAKSATTTAATTAAATSTTIARANNESPAQKTEDGGLVRQASLKINRQTREAQQEFIKRHTTGAASLTASEKLRQRRPTKATISSGGHVATSDDSDDLDDDDDDDDDDDYEYQNLASRRAYLNQRFIDQSQQEQQVQRPQPAQVVGTNKKTTSEATADKTTANRQSPNQQQQQINSASQVAKQRQRFSQGGAPIVRSNTIASGQRQQEEPKPVGVSTSRPTSRNNNNDDQQEPRSLGGMLTSTDLGRLYKPHMNYSTSLLGNHRLSDDDEIIIIPTAQSPSLMSASVSPDPRHHHSYQHQQYYQPNSGGGDEHHHHQQPDQSTNNMDEFSERFSISRTKSFWERLANAKKSPTGSGGGSEQQQYNSSIRSLTSSGNGPNLVAVDTKSSQGSLLMNDLKQQSPTSGGERHSPVARGAYPAAMKSAFDRMDSTGGSGNSHYSGCSSTSSASDADEAQVNGGAATTKAGYGRLQAKRAAAGVGRPMGQSPAIGQLIRQDELNRSDRFRQTR